MTESEIITGCRRNNRQCQHALFSAYAARLMNICLRYADSKYAAEEMLQNAFIQIFKTIQQYRFEGSLEGWIRKIAVRVCLGELRKKKLEFGNLNVDETIIDATGLDTVSRISEKELIGMISQLPVGYRIVFNLHVIEGYSHDEIASMLGIEAVTSRSQLLKARKMLQKQILSQQKVTAPHER